jgi:hypothetical protein
MKAIIIYENKRGTTTTTRVDDPHTVSLLAGMAEGDLLTYREATAARSLRFYEPRFVRTAILIEVHVDIANDELRLLVKDEEHANSHTVHYHGVGPIADGEPVVIGDDGLVRAVRP